MRDGNPEIYVMNANGTEMVRLTNDPGKDGFPTWSPDGSRIAFQSDQDGNFEVYVMDADGSNLVRLTDDPAGDGFPDWSPDGSSIAFASDRDGNFEIYVMDADGGNPIRITSDPAANGKPVWSPDGSRLGIHPSAAVVWKSMSLTSVAPSGSASRKKEPSMDSRPGPRMAAT